MVDAWAKCTDKVADEMMARIRAVQKDPSGRQKPMNSIYMMSHSGARGSPQQMKQLAGMRGLMAKPDGSIIESPITSNFKEGLTVMEYFNSTHGARKGLADTALKTANSGYLTRRLVDVAQDCIVTEVDCGTDAGLKMQAIIDSGQVVATLGHRVLGRTAAEDVIAPATGKVVIPAGTLIEERDVEAIEKANVQTIRIRSVLTCETKNGVCGKCYGRDLARGTPVNMGEAVGVIAAQSIGEPGTQLTMRTFHIGGTAQVVDQSTLESNFDGVVHFRNRNIVRDSEGRLIAMGRNMQLVIVDHRRHRAGGEPRHLRLAAPRRRGRHGQARPARCRVGSLHPPGADRGRGLRRLRGPRRSHLGHRVGRRVDRHHQARRRRLAGQSARRRPQAVDRRSRARTARSRRRRAAPTPATCFRSMPSCRSTRAPR